MDSWIFWVAAILFVGGAIVVNWRDWTGRSEAPAPQEDFESKLVWRAADDPENPFGVEVLDCRIVALGFYSATENPSVPDSFARLRRSRRARSLRKVAGGSDRR